eukprot:5709342-Pyramimonas_sp.AAC.3
MPERKEGALLLPLYFVRSVLQAPAPASACHSTPVTTLSNPESGARPARPGSSRASWPSRHCA